MITAIIGGSKSSCKLDETPWNGISVTCHGLTFSGWYTLSMDTPHTQAGFREVAHTADWEIEVWAPELCGLLEQAARAMYHLTSTRLEEGPRLQRMLRLPAGDRESLLVGFLSELIYLGEVEGAGFDRFDLRIDGDRLTARLEGARIESHTKEIKAVTYHGLSIRETHSGLQANLVFDV